MIGRSNFFTSLKLEKQKQAGFIEIARPMLLHMTITLVLFISTKPFFLLLWVFMIGIVGDSWS